MEPSGIDKHAAPAQTPKNQQNPAPKRPGEIRQSSETSGGMRSMDSDLPAVPSVDASTATFSFDAVEGFHASLLVAAPPNIRQRATRESWTTTALIAALQKASASSDSTDDPPKDSPTTTSHQYPARVSGVAAGGTHDSTEENALGLNINK